MNPSGPAPRLRTARFLAPATLVILLVSGLVGAPASPAFADCQGDVVWPSLDRARGTTFIGTFEGHTRNRDGWRVPRWTVERVIAGPLKPGPLDGWGITSGCHPTGYVKGERYLVSSQFAGGGDAFDTVAYRLLGDGRVRVANYPDQPAGTAPRIYRADTLADALDLLAPERSAATIGSGSTSVPFEASTTGRATSDLFTLRIATDREQVVEGEPITIDTKLRYIGTAKNKRASVTGPSGSLVEFRIKQIGGPVDTGPGWGAQCSIHRFAPGEVVDIPFEKSGGYDADGPMAEFWQTWFEDPELRLPRGRYEITAYLHHGPRGSRCSGASDTRTASVAIEVVPAAALAAAGAGS